MVTIGILYALYVQSVLAFGGTHELTLRSQGHPDLGWKDCNNNKQHDKLDLKHGLSFDCDGNSVPDECDIQSGVADCDDNGLPDNCVQESLILTDAFSGPDFDAHIWAQSPGVELSTQAIKPPSEPFAVRFDGAPNCIDELITRTMDLSGWHAVTLSYHWQRTGNGNSPDMHDHLFAQYRNSVGVWIDLAVHYGIGPDMVVFDHHIVKLPEDALHENAALRFTNTAQCHAIIQYDTYYLDDVTIRGQVAPDCNNNGMPDSCDVESGHADCDDNGIPDECEDCNANGIADACDIAEGLSLDVEGNNVPDECQQTLIVPSMLADLASAIGASENGDTILLEPGTYAGSGFCELDFSGKLLTISGQGGAEVTVIDCMSESRFLTLQSGETIGARLDGLTIRNGFASTQTFNGSDFFTDGGGAIWLNDSSIAISNCIFENNQSVHLDGTLATGHGGAIYAENADGLRIRNCQFVNNHCAQSGGALRLFECSNFDIRNSTFVNNTSNSAAAIQARGSTGQIHGATIAGNSASNKAGALLMKTGSIIEISNSIFWQNTGATGAPIRLEGAATGLSIEYSDVQDGLMGVDAGSATLHWQAGNMSIDPLFVDLAAGDVHLQLSSPVRDVGNPGYELHCPDELDIDHQPRVINAIIDMGADGGVRDRLYMFVPACADASCNQFTDSVFQPRIWYHVMIM